MTSVNGINNVILSVDCNWYTEIGTLELVD
jgi:hypothetical protein